VPGGQYVIEIFIAKVKNIECVLACGQIEKKLYTKSIFIL
jgi:hypothetical protein